MNKIFEKQKALDAGIVKKYGLEEPPYRERVLAFIVELGECANEWRGFKYWSERPVPKSRKMLLEEYVDMLHFIISLGISLGAKPEEIKLKESPYWSAESVTEQYLALSGNAYELYKYKNKMTWYIMFYMFHALAGMLGFSWERVEAAYMEKNAINHKRQVEGY